MAVLAALKSKSKNTMPTTQPKAWPNHGPSDAVPNCSPMKRSMSSCRFVSAAAMSLRVVRPVVSRARIEFDHAGEIRNRFHAGERENHAHKLNPKRAQTLMARLEKMCRQMWRADGDQRHNHDHSWHGKRDGQTARVFWPKPIDEPEEE